MKDVLKVELENIQAVKKASIEIEGFTAVVGRSNSGKSSLIRGMHAALTNKSPKTLFRTGTNQSSVKIEDVAKNISIEWKKGDKINAYLINGKEFTKVGKDVPKDVEEFGFKDIRVNDEPLEVQFARQHEYIFLLNRSGGFIADFISKITKADVLTGAVKDCESDIRKCNENIKSSQKEKDRLDLQLQRFISVDKIDTDLDETIKDIKKSITLHEDVIFLDASLRSFEDFQNQIKKLKNLPEILFVDFDINAIENIDCYIQGRDDLKAELSVLSKIPDVPKAEFNLQSLLSIESWVLERDIQKNKYVPLKTLNDFSVPSLDFKLADLELIEITYKSLKSRIPNLPDVPELETVSEKISDINNIELFRKDYTSVEADIISIQKQLKDTSDQIKNFFDQKKKMQKDLGDCPTCGRGFDGEEKDCSTHSG